MPRRWISAAVGVAVGLALLGAPAAARSAPVTKIGLTLYASEVSEGTPLMGIVPVTDPFELMLGCKSTLPTA